MLTRATLIVDGCEIPYAQAGSGSRVLICVNGMQQTMAGWAALLKKTATTGYRTVVFDFPNQGRAARSGRRASLTIEQQIQVLGAVVEHVSPGSPVALMGGSWGALLAAAYSSIHPDRVTKLLLCSFHTRPNVKVREIAGRGRALIESGRYDELAALFLSEFGNRIPQPLQEAIRTQFRRLRPEQLRQMYDQGLLLTGHSDLDAMFDLRRIKAETLVINGEFDPLIDHAAVADTLKRLPSATLHIEPEAGHFLHLERREIVDTYFRFLSAQEDQPAQLATRA